MVLWIGAVDLVKLRLDHVVLQLLGGLRLMVVHSVRRHSSGLGLGVVVLVEFLNVKTATSLVHVHSLVAHRALNLDGLGPVALLRVQLPPVAAHWLDGHDLTLVVTRSVVVRGRDDGLSGRVEPEVGLVHQLLVERRVHGGVVVGDGVGVGRNFGAVFE